MLLGTLGASLLGSILTGRGIYKARKGKVINWAGEGIVITGCGRPLSSPSHNNRVNF